MRQREEAEFARNQENFPFQIARQLSSQYGIPANVNDSGGINIKHKGEKHRIRVNGRLPYDQAFSDAFQQIVSLDPDMAIRRGASRRRMRKGKESIGIDDPLMERSFRGSLIDLISENVIEEKKKKDKEPKTVEEELQQKFNSKGNLALGYHKVLSSSMTKSKERAKKKCEGKGGSGDAKFDGPYKSVVDGKRYVVCTMKKKANESLSRGSLYRKRYYGRY